MADDPGPAARFEEAKRDAGLPALIFTELTDAEDPQTLPGLAKKWRYPRGEFVRWFTVEHADTYDAALKVLTDGHVFRAISIADGVEETKAAIAKAKLMIDVRLKTAARWDRERYGERLDGRLQVDDKRTDVDRETMLLETARSVAFILSRGGDVAAAKAGRPLLSAPAKREEKVVRESEDDLI